MKMKTLVIVMFSLFTITAIFVGCDSQKTVSGSDIPSEISEYVETHFPGNKILQTVEEKDGLEKGYDVILDDNTSLEFNRKKQITDVKSNSALPGSVIPAKIKDYVSQSFPDRTINGWKIEDRGQEVKLDNGMELKFSNDGDFIRIDN